MRIVYDACATKGNRQATDDKIYPGLGGVTKKLFFRQRSIKNSSGVKKKDEELLELNVHLKDFGSFAISFSE